MDKLKMHSPNLTEANITKLAELFPNCVTEAADGSGELKRAIDFDLLRQELSSSVVEGPQERYQLNWPGKREALLAANAPIAKTLRPYRKESINFDETQNIFIEGDNLEALKLLQESYLGKIKMIYIDPPYNTGSDFIYEDDFSEDFDEFFLKSNQKDELGNHLVLNTDANGRFHSDWLSMIYSRVRLARNLMTDDGVIFVSIDDNESANLRRLLDEVFGEDNLLSIHHIQVRYGNKSLNERKDFQELLETVFIYSKNKSAVRLVKPTKDYPVEKFNLKVNHNDLPDLSITKRGRQMDIWRAGSFEIVKTEPGVDGFKETWISGSILTGTGHGTMYTSMIDDRVEIDGNGCLYRIHGIGEDGLGYRYYTNPTDSQASRGKMYTKIPLNKREEVISGGASKDMPIINFYDFAGDFGNIRHEGGVPFNSGKKPLKLIRQLIGYVPGNDFTILDFFAGSATTGHATLEANSSDGGSRRFILVQIPEQIAVEDKVLTSITNELGVEPLISELSKERLRRAAGKISGENTDLLSVKNIDLGFRVFKIDTSNMRDVYYTPDAVTQNQLPGLVDNIREDRTPEDLLFQVLLDWGVDLSLPINQKTIGGKTVFFVDGNALVACFDKGIDEAFVKQIAEHKPLRVVFRDNGFADDSVKINVEQMFRLLSPSTEIKTL